MRSSLRLGTNFVDLLLCSGPGRFRPSACSKIDCRQFRGRVPPCLVPAVQPFHQSFRLSPLPAPLAVVLGLHDVGQGEESEKLKEAHARLLPHYNDTLRCEGDGKNLFAALAAFVNFRPYDQDAGFMEKWERNVSKPWVMQMKRFTPLAIM